MRGKSKEEVRRKFLDLVASVTDIPVDEIRGDARLGHDLEIDSLSLYDIVIEVEEAYGIQISNEEADALNTIEEALDYIYKKVGLEEA